MLLLREKTNHISIWIFIINVMEGVSLTLTWKSYSMWSTESLQRAAAFTWPSVGRHPPVEQMYVATGFVTLVHSYIQVTVRSIDYILFVRALGVSMWKQSWLKYFNLNIPLFLIRTNFMKETKNIVNSNFTSQKAKIAPQNQKIFSAGYKPPFAQEIITKLLCEDNSNADWSESQSIGRIILIWGNCWQIFIF